LLTRVVAIEREATLEATPNIRMMLQPPSMRREAMTVRHVIATREALERQVRERRRRLAKRKSWMGSSLEQHHVAAQPSEHARHDGAGESAADDGDLTAFGHRI